LILTVLITERIHHEFLVGLPLKVVFVGADARLAQRLDHLLAVVRVQKCFQGILLSTQVHVSFVLDATEQNLSLVVPDLKGKWLLPLTMLLACALYVLKHLHESFLKDSSAEESLKLVVADLDTLVDVVKLYLKGF